MYEERLIHNFKLMFPSVAEHAIRYVPQNDSELVVHLDDSASILYDDFNKSFRELPKDSNAMTKDECKKEYGKRLTAIMRNKGMSQLALSQITGIPQPSISAYASGKNIPGFYQADKIAKALGCSTDAFRYVDISKE